MTWAEIISQARDLSLRFRSDGSVAWFRGHPDANYTLKSTLHRYVERRIEGFEPPPAEDQRQLLRDEYKTLYRRFKADAWPLLGAHERSEWGIIFAMQHYGLPTRLLDLTESFACAVFFAQMDRNSKCDAAIWVLDPQALNRISIEREGLLQIDNDESSPAIIDSRKWHPKWGPPNGSILKSVAVSPIFTNPRMNAQHSAFTMSGDSFLPLNEEFTVLAQSKRLEKLLLPANTYEEANAYLDLAGLDAFSFYPDLHGLALRHEAKTEKRIAESKVWYPKNFK